MQAQGIEVVGVHFASPVFRYEKPGLKSCDALATARQLGIPLETVDITEDLLKILKNPKHGFGSNINPCIDCHTRMLKKAKEMMRSLGASFLVTGEVAGQRPMSQGSNTLSMIDREAGVQGLVLRPLSAKVLEKTVPEEKGWVDRNALKGISGRSRREQIALADAFGIKEYANPAGGCLLTDPQFSKRIKDLIDHDELTIGDVNLLQFGRYFRISEKAIMVVGRNQANNESLEALVKENDILLMPGEEVPGASALGRGDWSNHDTILLAGRIISRYFDKQSSSQTARVVVRSRNKEETIEVEPFSDEEARKYLI
jgi:tRNA-specific 2-thiouridylase